MDNNLINELALGRELAQQLLVHLHGPASSPETREMLLQKILASYEKALTLLSSSAGSSSPMGLEPLPSATAGPLSESPPSHSGSPRSEDSDRDLRDQLENRDGSRKRKSMPRWTKQVRVSPGMGLEGPLEDGFSWRKYGQKDILGAKFPRGYYRCTHRNVQGCLATKQVQRSDEDPTIFEVTYRGRHTCNQGSTLMLPPSQQTPDQSQEPKHTPDQQQQHSHQENPHPQQQSQELLMNFRSGLKVITEDLDMIPGGPTQFSSFHFPSTSNNVESSSMFSTSMVESSFMGNYSPSFISPSTSAAGTSNYFLGSPSALQQQQQQQHHVFGGNQNNFQHHHNSESELNEIVPAATSATNSPTVGFDFPYGNVDFDSNFTFDNQGFLSQ